MVSKHFGRASIMVVFFASFGLARAESSGARAIRAMYARWQRAFISRDVKAISTLYAPNVYAFDVIPPRAYPNRAAYMADYAELFKQLPGRVTCRVEDLAITADSSMAFAHCVVDSTMTDPHGQKVRSVVRVTDVFRKRHGRWQIVHEHVSVPVDLMTGKADMLSQP